MLDTIPYGVFILMPLERNVGIIMANDIVLASLDTELAFASHVIDPADAYNMFLMDR